MKYLAIFVTCLATLVQGRTLTVTPLGDEGACGDDQPRVITEPTVFYSPNYGEGQTYPPNQDCTWLFQVDSEDPDDNIRIQFSDFSVEETTDCLFDFVEAFDGTDANAPSLGRRCGSTAADFGSSGQDLFLRFVSDGSTEFRGFEAGFSVVILPPPFCIPGSNPIEITESTGNITSPGYPGFYPENLQCRWLLNTPGATGYRIEFLEEFDTEDCCQCDYLEIWQGASILTGRRWARWWGDDEPFTYGLVGQEQLVLFVTDSSVNDIGFQFQFTALF